MARRYASCSFLKKGQESYESPKAVGHGFDRFIGTWSDEQEAEVLKAVEILSKSTNPSGSESSPGYQRLLGPAVQS